MLNAKRLFVFLAVAFASAIPARAQFAAQQTWQATSTGTANAVIIGMPNVSSIADLVGVPIRFLPSATNTGPATASVGGTAATAVKKATQNGLAALGGQEMVAGQLTVLVYDGTQYVIHNTIAPQPILFTNTTYCVATSGNDTNSGISPNCWLTLQHAATFISQYNANGFTITINVANGTYAPVNLLPVGGNGFVNWVGNTGSPGSVLISATNNSAVKANGVTGQTLNGFGLQATGSSPVDSLGACVSVTGQSAISLGNIAFGACFGDGIFAQQSSVTLLTSTFTISGSSTGESCSPGCGAFLDSNYGAFIASAAFGPSINITSAITIAEFAEARGGGLAGVTFSSITNPSNVTGKRFDCNLNGVIEVLGSGVNYYPGSSAGTTSTGCQYN